MGSACKIVGLANQTQCWRFGAGIAVDLAISEVHNPGVKGVIFFRTGGPAESSRCGREYSAINLGLLLLAFVYQTHQLCLTWDAPVLAGYRCLGRCVFLGRSEAELAGFASTGLAVPVHTFYATAPRDIGLGIGDFLAIG